MFQPPTNNETIWDHRIIMYLVVILPIESSAPVKPRIFQPENGSVTFESCSLDVLTKQRGTTGRWCSGNSNQSRCLNVRLLHTRYEDERGHRQPRDCFWALWPPLSGELTLETEEVILLWVTHNVILNRRCHMSCNQKLGCHTHS